MKKRMIFLCVVSVSVLINVILFYILKGKVGIDNIRSISFESFQLWCIKALFTIAMIIHGIAAYFLRRRGNYIAGRKKGRLGVRDDRYHKAEDYESAEEYRKEFFWQFCVYWFVIPFYFPFVYFHWGYGWIFFWLMVVMCIPSYVSIIWDMIKEIKIGKTLKIKKQKQEQELKEQLMREELGHLK